MSKQISRSLQIIFGGLCLAGLAACATPTPAPTATLPPTASPLPPTLTPVPSDTMPPPTAAATERATLAKTATPVTLPPTLTPVTACPGAPPVMLQVGRHVMVSLDPPVPSRVRAQPVRTAELLGEIQPGTWVEIIGGPQCADDFTWWRIKSSQDLIGWTVEGDVSGYWLVTATPIPVAASATPGPSATPRAPSAVGSGEIAFTVVENGRTQIYLTNAEGAAPVNLSNSAENDLFFNWAPDGGSLAFARGAGAQTLWVMNADGSGQTQLYASAGEIKHAVWSPDSGRLAFCELLPTENAVYVINRDGSGLTQLDRSRLNYQVPCGAQWSPDGVRVYYVGMVGNPENQPGYWDATIDVYVSNADGSGRTNLTPSRAPDFAPAPAPDGSRLAFVRNNVLWLMPATGGGQTPITLVDKHGTVWGQPVWLDARQLVFFATNDWIYLPDVEGVTFQNLGTLGTGPSFSPDRSRLAYTTNGQLYVLLTTDWLHKTAPSRPIGLPNVYVRDPHWRP